VVVGEPDEEEELEVVDEDDDEVELELEPSEDVVPPEPVELLDEAAVLLPA
jgi:hypothetical protein